MMILAPCPHCHQRTAQLLQWHGGVPEDHTRHWCQTCQVTWDEYDPLEPEDYDYDPDEDELLGICLDYNYAVPHIEHGDIVIISNHAFIVDENLKPIKQIPLDDPRIARRRAERDRRGRSTR